ncbi:MAG: phosphoenolpyruvate carboxykinase (GTP) [Deltaproteobacteria bacterium]|nr:phosphoenolpyruvate carboxykinase (GTP) [Deltaproteobacteria bacterium]
MANQALKQWVDSIAKLATPDRIVWCNGSAEEDLALKKELVSAGTLIALNEKKWPNSFLYRSHPNDVARTEAQTFICSRDKADAGPTNNWMSPADAETRVYAILRQAMRGRTMYVVPYLMGPVGSPCSRVGVEITDSPYVVISMRVMTRMGQIALDHLGDGTDFVRGVHCTADLHPERRYICHFPETSTILSVGSGYGGNALLSKKCHSLRLASVQGRRENWLAEHMLILGVTTPAGHKHYVAAAFPSACGKTNLALLVSALPGYKVETVGDDICWLHPGNDGRLWAVNPEAGMFGVAPGTNTRSNPNAMTSVRQNAIFTNVALTADGSPWWEGLDDEVPGRLTDWRGLGWTLEKGEPAAHPNARFTVSLRECPSMSREMDSTRGVPISAILFGGRRARLAPLVYEAFNWDHGVYVGATMVSETTAAANGDVGVPRNDPMAMLPFCGYNMGDYFAHWLTFAGPKRPKIFHVNWFRKDNDGKFLWPGYGENIRVLKWILDRVEDRVSAIDSPIGRLPRSTDIDTSNMLMPANRLRALLDVDRGTWLQEAERNGAFLERFGDRLPMTLRREHGALIRRLEFPPAA